MITLQLTAQKNIQPENSTLIVFVDEKNNKFVPLGAPKEVVSHLATIKKEGFQASDLKKGLLFRRVEGLGFKNIIYFARPLDKKKSQMNTKEQLRRLSAQILAALKDHKLTNSVLHLESLGLSGKEAPDVIQGFAEGFLLSDYEFKDFKSKPKEKSAEDKAAEKKYSIHFLSQGVFTSAACSNALKSAIILSEVVNFSRRLGDHPGNLMTPEILADQTVQAAKGTGLKVTVWDKQKIKKERMGGLYGVSLGSAVEPRFIIMEYNNAPKSKKPIVFVGKGLTFDSGGISIKPSGAMEEMIYDMCGGANVIGTLLAIARLKLKVNVVGLVPATENMPGPLANKPGDILTARNGKTVEVYNTDAEGRLILMDALSYACELKPAAIFDAATLTGAIVVALGNSYTGVFTRDSKLAKTIQEAAHQAGEDVWPMPINDHHVEDMKGLHADLCNISSFKGAGSSTAAAFLEQFVDKDIPWAHFDIAGTAWNVGNRVPYCPRKGASGVMIRTFVELAQAF